MRPLLTRLVKLTAVVTIVASTLGPNTPLILTAHAQSAGVFTTGTTPVTGVSGTGAPSAGSGSTPVSTTETGSVGGGGSASAGASVTAPSGGNTSTSNSGQVTASGTGSANANTNSNTTAGADLQCSTSDIAVCVSGFVYWITVGIGSWFANIAAYLFDYAVQLSLQSSAYALDFIAIGWGVVRDVANMSFLFILLYIGFKVMFQAETAGTIRMLVWVVIIALLVNFSFLMTRLVIDAGNIVALQFYNAVAPPGTRTIQNPGGTSTNGSSVSATQTADITASIMNAINPQRILGADGFKNFISNKSKSQMYYLIVSSVTYLLVGVTMFMLAAIFIFAGLRFVVRVIGLWFVIIAAPVAFVAAIFRGKEGGSVWFNKWLGYLLEFSFYPAVFLFMYYIEVRFANEMGSSPIFNNIYNATSSGADWTVIVQASANVAVRLGFILATMTLILRASQWMGSAFNSMGTKWAQDGLVRIGRNSLKLGGRGVTFATQATRAGIQSQANVATRSGVNSSLWRNINRVVGGTNLPKPRALTLSGISGAGNTALSSAQQNAARREAAQGVSANERKEPTIPDYTGAAPEPRAWSPVRSRENGTLPAGARIEPVIPMGRAPEVRVGSRNTQGVINQVAQNSAARHAQPSTLNIAAQRAIENLKETGKQAQTTARAGAVNVTLANTPDLSRSTNTKAQEEAKTSAPAEYRQQAEEIKEGIKGLGQTVSAAIAAAKSGTTQPTMVIQTPAHTGPTTVAHVAASSAHAVDDEEKANKIASKVARKLESKLGSHDDNTPPTPTAPAAVQPSPQAHNDDYPYSQAAE